MPDVEPLPREWKLGKEGCPNFLAILTRNLTSSTSSGREWEVLGSCLSQWNMVSLDLELRGRRDLSSWPHPPRGKFALTQLGDEEGGNGSWLNCHRFLLFLLSFSSFFWRRSVSAFALCPRTKIRDFKQLAFKMIFIGYACFTLEWIYRAPHMSFWLWNSFTSTFNKMLLCMRNFMVWWIR